MRLLHRWSRAAVQFDEANLVSCAGLAPVMALAERAGLSRLVSEKVAITGEPVPSTGANPAGKITSIVAGMVAGSDSIDDLDVVRHGGMKRLFGGVYAPSTLGSFLRAFTHGHVAQLVTVLKALLLNLARQTPLLPGIEKCCFVDIDSLLRPVYGHQKRGGRFGPAKVGGYSLLLRGLSPLVATLSTRSGAPVIAGMRLRGGNAGSARGAASLLSQALATARAAGASGRIVVRGDSAYYAGTVISATRRLLRLGISRTSCSLTCLLPSVPACVGGFRGASFRGPTVMCGSSYCRRSMLPSERGGAKIPTCGCVA